MILYDISTFYLERFQGEREQADGEFIFTSFNDAKQALIDILEEEIRLTTEDIAHLLEIKFPNEVPFKEESDAG